MTASKAQIEAVRRYEKENTKSVLLVLNKKSDADILGWLEKKPSKMGSIKEAIREKITKENADGRQ